jgi:hypothetical protein
MIDSAGRGQSLAAITGEEGRAMSRSGRRLPLFAVWLTPLGGT